MGPVMLTDTPTAGQPGGISPDHLIWSEYSRSQMLKRRKTHPFDGAPGLLLPLLAAQLQRAVNIGFSVIGTQDEQPAEA